MRVNINFEFYPDFNNHELYASSTSVFKVYNPKIELKKEEFEESLKIFFKEKFDYNESHTFIDFHQFRNKLYIEFYIDIYDEISNKKELNDCLEDLICNIIQDLGWDLYSKKDVIEDKVKLRIEFRNGAVFYNTYEYKMGKGCVWLNLKNSIGEFNNKMIRYDKFLKKELK